MSVILILLLYLTLCITYMYLSDMSKFVMSECQESQHGIHTEVSNSGIELTENYVTVCMCHTQVKKCEI